MFSGEGTGDSTLFDLLEGNEIFAGDFYPNEIDYSKIIWDSEHQSEATAVESGELPKLSSSNSLVQIPPSAPFPVAAIVAGNKRRSKADSNHQTKAFKPADVLHSPSLLTGSDYTFSTGSASDRRERNREHAKQSRSRKKVLLDALSDRLSLLRNQNLQLRNVISERLPDKASEILSECTVQDSTLLTSDSAIPFPSSSSSTAEAPMNGSSEAKVLMQPDYQLIQSLVTSQQNFLLTDPNLPDNPIVYASDGFCKLTKYKRNEIIGRNCRFLQGAGTDPVAVSLIRKGIAENRDVSVCLLNYKADGTPFWNQFFLGALRDSNQRVINFVGVQCEVNIVPVSELKEKVKRLMPL